MEGIAIQPIGCYLDYNIFILSLLSHDDYYPEELASLLDSLLDPKFFPENIEKQYLSEGSIRKRLSKMQSLGHLTRYEVESPVTKGAFRHYYKITNKGRDFLDTLQEASDRIMSYGEES